MRSRDFQELERTSLLPKSHYHSTWYRKAYHVPRWLRWVLIIAFLCGLTAFYRFVSDLHDQALKFHATDFSGLHSQGAELWSPSHAERENFGSYIGDRYRHVRHLASGKEGSVDMYHDEESDRPVVIKTYGSISRNPIPRPPVDEFENFTSSWPTEIEAGLLLVKYPGFVPALDYFVLLDNDQWSWALVSSFMSNGTLDKLARAEKLSDNNTLNELNIRYRPSLDSLLSELRSLHKAGLCHDDVKMDNIFTRSPTEWLLGDLGNIRHFSHPWHSTASWTRQNQWSNCHLNDIRRALKTYLWFLRSATSDVVEFDRKFWTHEEDWARLYWSFHQCPHDFEMMLHGVRVEELASKGRLRISNSELAIATERELICTTIPRRLWPWYWKYAPIW